MQTLIAAPHGGPCPAIIEVMPTGEPVLETICVLDMLSEPVFGGYFVPVDPDWLLRAGLPACITPGMRTFFASLGRLVHFVQGWQGEAASSALDEVVAARRQVLLSQPECVTTQTVEVMTFMSDVIEHVISPLEHIAVYPRSQFSHSDKSWWATFPPLRTEVRVLRESLSMRFGKPIPSGLLCLVTWLVTLEDRLGRMCSAGTSEEVAMREASALCAAVSTRLHLRGERTMSMLYLHRSAEWLLNAKCSAAGYVNFATHGGVYFSNGNALTFRDTLATLKAVVPLGGIESELEELNQWRNQAVLTHHLTTMASSVADRLYSTIMPRLSKLANREWERAYDFYTAVIPLSARTVLDPAGRLMGLSRRVMHIAKGQFGA
jgi:hypothetical protein